MRSLQSSGTSADMPRRRVLGAGAALLVAAWGGSIPARAQGPLVENARMLAGFPPGGTADVMARRYADRFRGTFARTIIVENRTGAGGQIAVAAMRGAPPDGSALLMTPGSMLMIYPHIYKNLSYNPFEDLTPVGIAGWFSFGFAVGPMVPESVKSLADFLKWAAATPAQATFGSPAAGSTPHFMGEMIAKASRAPLRHVPYRGTQAAITDMLGGQIASVAGPEGEFIPHLKSGRVRLLATSGNTRSRFTSNVPTFAEQGYPGIQFREWFGLFLPAKANPGLVQHGNAALVSAAAAPDLVEGIGQFAVDAASSSPDALAQVLKTDYEKWGGIVRDLDLPPDRLT